MGSRVAHMMGKPGRRKFGTHPIALGALVQFLRGKEEFTLRVSLQPNIGRTAGHPEPLDLCVSGADIKGIVAYRDRRFDDFGIAKRIVPVGKVMDLDPAALLDDTGPFGRRWTGRFQKAVIVGYPD